MNNSYYRKVSSLHLEVGAVTFRLPVMSSGTVFQMCGTSCAVLDKASSYLTNVEQVTAGRPQLPRWPDQLE